MVPALFGVSVSQLNLLLDTVLASFLPTGSVSWLYYSDRLTELPLGRFRHRRGHGDHADPVGHKRCEAPGGLHADPRLGRALRAPRRRARFAGADHPRRADPHHPVSLRRPDRADIAMAGLSLRAYSVGLCAFMLVKVLAPGFYARKDMKTPVRIGIRAMVANMGMNLLFVSALVLTDNPGHVGLALATSLGACLNAGLLWRGLLREGVYRFDPVWRPFLARLGFACVLMVTAL
jgi:putative peptidoglycan lipid II flippase